MKQDNIPNFDQPFDHSEFIETFDKELYENLLHEDILIISKSSKVTFGSPTVRPGKLNFSVRVIWPAQIFKNRDLTFYN